MSLLELPIECFRLILKAFMLEKRLEPILNLRLVNRVFDTEVLYAIETSKILKDGAQLIRYDTGRCGCAGFFATYLSGRPYSQEPWNSNLSSFLNCIVDEVLRRDREDKENIVSRKRYLQGLIRHSHELTRSDVGESMHAFVRDGLYSDSTKRATSATAFDFHLLAAQVLLRRSGLENTISEHLQLWGENRSAYFGSLPEAAVKGGNHFLFRLICDEYVRRGLRGDMVSRQVFERAVEFGDKEMVKLVLNGPFCPSPNSPLLGPAVKASICESRIGVALLILNHTDQLTPEALWKGLSYASERGFTDILEKLLDLGGDHDIDGLGPGPTVSPSLIELAAWKGRTEALQLLLSRGANPYGRRERGPAYSMLAAAFEGRVEVAKILLDAGVRFAPKSWARVYLRAIKFRQPHFLQFLLDQDNTATIRDILNDEANRHAKEEAMELVAAASHYGDADAIKAFVRDGMPVDGPLYEEVLPGANLMLVALCSGREKVIRALLDLGMKPIDPLNTGLREGLLTGVYPRKMPLRHSNYMPWRHLERWEEEY